MNAPDDRDLPRDMIPPDTIHADTIVELFLNRVERSPESEALLSGKIVDFLPWIFVEEDVFRGVACLQAAGIGPGDRVCQLSENSSSWITVDLAVQLLGAVHIALHASLSPKQVHAQLEDCDPHALIVSNREQWKKIANRSRWQGKAWMSHEIPRDEDGLAPWNDPCDFDADEIRSHAREIASPDRLATIIYTSGSTGQPRGAMLTSGNLASNACAMVDAFEERPGDLRLNFLPLSHVFARTCDLYSWIARGSQLALCRSRETIIEDCQTIGPTLINGVPYFFDKVRRTLIEKRKADQPGILRKTLGGNIRLCSSGGAALADETVAYYESQGVTLVQGYGLTETSPVISLSTESVHRRGSVGKPLAGVEVEIADDGEILTRGPHVMAGYWRDEQATAEAIIDGWFHTGDQGRLDEDGFLWITGRKKEMIVTAGGKTIAPAAIETRLMLDPLIEQACVVGDGQKYLAALIVPNPNALRAALKQMRLWVFSRRGALRHRKVLELYREVIDRRLADLSSHEQVRKFHLLGRGFTPESGELTPKLSLRRKVIDENLRSEIATLFT